MFQTDLQNNMEITRGDTVPLHITAYLGGRHEYHLRDGDIIHFVVQEELGLDNPILLEKTIAREPAFDKVEGVILILTSEDTRSLVRGKYRYKVYLETFSGDIYTFITADLTIYD